MNRRGRPPKPEPVTDLDFFNEMEAKYSRTLRRSWQEVEREHIYEEVAKHLGFEMMRNGDKMDKKVDVRSAGIRARLLLEAKSLQKKGWTKEEILDYIRQELNE